MSFSLIEHIKVLEEKKEVYERKAKLLSVAGILLGENRVQSELYSERARLVGLMIQAQREGIPVSELLKMQENPTSLLLKSQKSATPNMEPSYTDYQTSPVTTQIFQEA